MTPPSIRLVAGGEIFKVTLNDDPSWTGDGDTLNSVTTGKGSSCTLGSGGLVGPWWLGAGPS